MLCMMLAAVAAVAAGDFTIKLDPTTSPLNDYSKIATSPGAGYTWDSLWNGGEAAALKYRREGVWLVRMESLDEKDLAFLKKYEMKAVVRLEGKPKKLLRQMKRVGEMGLSAAIVGFETEMCAPGREQAMAAKWPALFEGIREHFPKAGVGVTLGDPADDAALAAAFGEQFKNFTHAVCDMSDAASPYATLVQFQKRLSAPEFKDKRIWLSVRRGRPGAKKGRDFQATLWKMHVLLTAYSRERVDAVFFGDVPREDGSLGAAMRYLAGAIRQCPVLLKHGEGMQAEPAETKQDVSADGGKETVAIEPDPKACAIYGEALNKGEKNPEGDVEWVALTSGSKGYISLLMVNTRKSAVKVTVEVDKYKHNAAAYRTVRCAGDGQTAVRDCREEFTDQSRPIVVDIDPDTFQTVTFPIRKLR